MPTKKKRKTSPTKKYKPLPRAIRNELRTACAMKGHSKMKSGKKMRLSEQWDFMGKFFHGRPPNYPSQIEMLAEGRVGYADLFEEVEVPATKKKDDINTVTRLRLKQIITNDERRVYYSGTDIRPDDLENFFDWFSIDWRS